MSATARTSIYVGYDDEDEERTAKAVIISLMSRAEIKGYTMYSAQGFWEGQEEKAIIIEVIGDNADLDFGLAEVAHSLRHNELLMQDSVYVVTELVDLVVF